MSKRLLSLFPLRADTRQGPPGHLPIGGYPLKNAFESQAERSHLPQVAARLVLINYSGQVAAQHDYIR